MKTSASFNTHYKYLAIPLIELVQIGADYTENSIFSGDYTSYGLLAPRVDHVTKSLKHIMSIKMFNKIEKDKQA